MHRRPNLWPGPSLPGVPNLRLEVGLGVEPRRRSEERVARFGRSATAEAAGDPFRALASACALAEVFELVLLLGMLEGVSR